MSQRERGPVREDCPGKGHLSRLTPSKVGWYNAGCQEAAFRRASGRRGKTPAGASALPALDPVSCPN